MCLHVCSFFISLFSAKGLDPEVFWKEMKDKSRLDLRPHPIRGPDVWTTPNGIVMAKLATNMTQEAINARRAGNIM